MRGEEEKRDRGATLRRNDALERKREKEERASWGSLLPASKRCVCTHTFACVHTQRMSTQKIRKEVHSVEEKKSRRPHRRRLARVYPLPPHSIGRLIFYSGRSRICIRSGALFPFTFLSLCLSLPFSFSLWPLSSLRIHASVCSWDIIRIILQSENEKYLGLREPENKNGREREKEIEFQFEFAEWSINIYTKEIC